MRRDTFWSWEAAESLYVWLSQNHTGQWSDEYKALSELTRSFKSRMVKMYNHLDIDATNWRETWDELREHFEADEEE